MRTLEINKQIIHYKEFVGEESVKDGGFDTLEMIPKYGMLKTAYVHVSADTGSVIVDRPGEREVYARQLVYSRKEYPFTEQTIFWIDADPYTEEHDYIVSRISESINTITVQLSKVARR